MPSNNVAWAVAVARTAVIFGPIHQLFSLSHPVVSPAPLSIAICFHPPGCKKLRRLPSVWSVVERLYHNVEEQRCRRSGSVLRVCKRIAKLKAKLAGIAKEVAFFHKITRKCMCIHNSRYHLIPIQRNSSPEYCIQAASLRGHGGVLPRHIRFNLKSPPSLRLRMDFYYGYSSKSVSREYQR